MWTQDSSEATIPVPMPPLGATLAPCDYKKLADTWRVVSLRAPKIDVAPGKFGLSSDVHACSYWSPISDANLLTVATKR